MTFASIDALLDDARSRLARVTPKEAFIEAADGAVLVDIRPAWQREGDGEIPGSLIVERNHLEWRLHPESGAHLPVARAGQRWIVFCTEGYTSSLAAASLVSLGLDATDIVGGLRGWNRSGLPVAASVTAVEAFVA